MFKLAKIIGTAGLLLLSQLPAVEAQEHKSAKAHGKWVEADKANLVGSVWRAAVQFEQGTAEYELKCLSHESDGSVTVSVIRLSPYLARKEKARLVTARGMIAGRQLTLSVPYYGERSGRSASAGTGSSVASSQNVQWIQSVVHFDPQLKSASGIFGRKCRVTASRSE